MSEYEEGKHVGVRERSSRFHKRAIARVFFIKRLTQPRSSGSSRLSAFSRFLEASAASDQRERLLASARKRGLGAAPRR